MRVLVKILPSIHLSARLSYQIANRRYQSFIQITPEKYNEQNFSCNIATNEMNETTKAFISDILKASLRKNLTDINFPLAFIDLKSSGHKALLVLLIHLYGYGVDEHCLRNAITSICERNPKCREDNIKTMKELSTHDYHNPILKDPGMVTSKLNTCIVKCQDAKGDHLQILANNLIKKLREIYFLHHFDFTQCENEISSPQSTLFAIKKDSLLLNPCQVTVKLKGVRDLLRNTFPFASPAKCFSTSACAWKERNLYGNKTHTKCDPNYNFPYLSKIFGTENLPMRCDAYSRAVLEAAKRRSALEECTAFNKNSTNFIINRPQVKLMKDCSECLSPSLPKKIAVNGYCKEDSHKSDFIGKQNNSVNDTTKIKKKEPSGVIKKRMTIGNSCKREKPSTGAKNTYEPKEDPCEKKELNFGKKDTVKETNYKENPCKKNQKVDPFEKETTKENLLKKENPIEDPCKKEKLTENPCRRENPNIDVCKKEKSKEDPHKKENLTEDTCKKEDLNSVSCKKEPTNEAPCKKEPLKGYQYKKENPKEDPCKKEKPQRDPFKKEKAHEDPCKKENPKPDPCKEEIPKENLYNKEPLKEDPCRKEMPRKDLCKKENTNENPCQRENVKEDLCKTKDARPEGKPTKDIVQAEKTNEAKCGSDQNSYSGTKLGECYTPIKETKPNCGRDRKCFSTLAIKPNHTSNSLIKGNYNFCYFPLMRDFSSKNSDKNNKKKLDELSRTSQCKAMGIAVPPKRKTAYNPHPKDGLRRCYPTNDMDCKKLCKDSRKTDCRKYAFLNDTDDNERKGKK